MPLATILGISAATVLIIAGYIFGTKHGFRAREKLRQQSLLQARELLNMRKQHIQSLKEDDDALVLKKDLGKMTQALLRQSDAMHRMLEPLNRRDAEVDSLRSIVEQALTPLTHHERLAFELSNLDTNAGNRSDLARLLDEIAKKGQFWDVSLHDEQGLPLAASSNSKNIDRLTAIAAMVLLFAERIGRNGSPTPLSLLIHDEANMATLCRIFHVGEQRLLLSAVSTGAQITPTALDPALTKVDAVLSTPH